jgi:hypothetical protein
VTSPLAMESVSLVPRRLRFPSVFKAIQNGIQIGDVLLEAADFMGGPINLGCSRTAMTDTPVARFERFEFYGRVRS